MQMIRLKNGSEEAEPLVKVIMLSLNSLLETKPIVAYELVMKCRDRNHKLFGISGEDLKKLALIGEDGQPHDSVRISFFPPPMETD
jgi:hypothetical protein